jgi:hypothetical protein
MSESQKYWSKSTSGFYDSIINTSIPLDAVEITDDYWMLLLDGQSNGKIITSDFNDYPILANPPPPSSEENKNTASALLTETDWTTIADVADPINSPYLANQAEFIAYRNLVRQIAVYPTAGDLIWPVKPNKVWA